MDAMVEIGPGKVLSGFLENCQGDSGLSGGGCGIPAENLRWIKEIRSVVKQ